jgi:hypothetical protein
MLDLAYLLLLSNPAAGDSGVIELNIRTLPHLTGGVFWLLLVLSVCCVLINRHSTAGLCVGSLGLANAIALISDAFLRPELQMSHHAGYFVPFVMSIQLLFLLHQGVSWILPDRKAVVFGVVGAFSLMVGIVAGEATYQSNLSRNENTLRFSRVLSQLPLQAGYLVVAPAQTVDDPAVFVPLLSPARVLFTTNAEMIMTHEQKQNIQSERQAEYLYLRGLDRIVLDNSVGVNPKGLMAFANLDERAGLNSSHDYQRTAEAIYSRLSPLLKDVAANGGSVTAKGFSRVFVIDYQEKQVFAEDRIRSAFDVQEERTYSSLNIRVYICSDHAPPMP